MGLKYDYIPTEFIEKLKSNRSYRFENYTLDEQAMCRRIGRKNFIRMLDDLETFLPDHFYKLSPEYKLPEELTVRHFLKTNTHAFATLPKDARDYLKEAGLRNCLALTPRDDKAEWDDCGLLSTNKFHGNWTYRLKDDYRPVPEEPFVEYEVFQDKGLHYVRLPSGPLMLHKVFTRVGFAGFKLKNPFTGEERPDWSMTLQLCFNEGEEEKRPMIPARVRFYQGQ